MDEFRGKNVQGGDAGVPIDLVVFLCIYHLCVAASAIDNKKKAPPWPGGYLLFGALHAGAVKFCQENSTANERPGKGGCGASKIM